VVKRLAIVGGGAKAAAMAARNATLRKLLTKRSVPELLVFEKDHVGSAWSGGSGFSSGFLTLCTPGERDVGFPYDEVHARGGASAPVGPALFAGFSWTAWLVATGRMGEWVDRGREHPRHSLWADYLEWVFDRAGQNITFEAVSRVEALEGGWRVYHGSAGASVQVDGVLLTGTGRSRTIKCAPDAPPDRIMTAETFWNERERIRAFGSPRIAVAGDGGSAGTIVAWLAEAFAETNAMILSVSPMGTLFPRGDGYVERRWFSDPSDWRALGIEDRAKLISRTEAGVISLRVKGAIDRSNLVNFEKGKAVLVQWDEDEKELVLSVDYKGGGVPIRADFFINAIGFDSWSLLEMVDAGAVRSLDDVAGEDLRKQVEEAIERDLSLSPRLGMPPGLHVPALAGLARGPGMGNLGCLGLMARSVHDAYIV
jgi:mycobactin lysine-N-oxygenase